MAQSAESMALTDAINVKVDELQGGVDRVQADVQVLIDRIGSGTPPDESELLAALQGIDGKLGALKADVDSTPRPPEA